MKHSFRILCSAIAILTLKSQNLYAFEFESVFYGTAKICYTNNFSPGNCYEYTCPYPSHERAEQQVFKQASRCHQTTPFSYSNSQEYENDMLCYLTTARAKFICIGDW